jgi:hypothetical protein
VKRVKRVMPVLPHGERDQVKVPMLLMLPLMMTLEMRMQKMSNEMTQRGMPEEKEMRENTVTGMVWYGDRRSEDEQDGSGVGEEHA